MAGFELRDFRGLNETRDERLLGVNEATNCSGLLFDGSGTLRAWDSPWYNVHSFGVVTAPRTIFYHEMATPIWLRWDDEVEVAKGPVAGDTLNRIYITGDGAPKMTYEGLSPTLRPLGVPAPTGAPTTVTTTPTTVLSGYIEEVTCANLMMIHEMKGSDGDIRQVGYNVANVVSGDATPSRLTALAVGAQLKVASIVDVDHITVTGVGGINYATIVDKQDYHLQFDTASSPRLLWKARYKGFWNFLIPGGAELKITAHSLQAGDIIQVSAYDEQMGWTFATLTTSPITDQNARTAVLAATGDIIFTGSVSFLVNRDGTTIDPLVPQQNYDIELRSYVYTYVTSLGEESAPSPPSDILSVYSGTPVTVSGFSTPPGGYDITHKRIYRTNTGTEGTEYQFVAEIAVATTSYDDSLADSELAEVLPSESWTPPDADMRGLVTLPNGMMAGYIADRKLICFCEPGYPHAWPEEYQYPIDHEPVSMAAFGTSLFVGTKGNPYVFVGVHPRQMAWQRIPIVEPCVGIHSATNIGDRVAYTSPNGIIVVTEGSASNFTENLIPREMWRAMMSTTLAGHNIRGYWYDNRVEFVQSGDGFTDDGFISVAINGDRVDISYDCRAETASYVDPASGRLYRARIDPNASNAIRVQRLLTEIRQDAITVGGGGNYWDGIAAAVWESKRIEFERPMNMAWARVELDYSGGNPAPAWDECALGITFSSRLTNRTEHVHTASPVNLAAPAEGDLLFRLPAGFLTESVVVKFDLAGFIRVKSLKFGETIQDVQ